MIELTVKTLDSQNHAFTLEDDITVRGFKEYIAESVSVPADSQRLIYCGRVLQDDKKLNDYDVNGKVIHLVQRAPPQPGQRGNTSAEGQSNNNQNWTHFRHTRAQVHGNAMYLGAMSVPAEVIEGHGLPPPRLSNTLSNSRLIIARRMLQKANQLMDHMDDPSVPLNPPSESTTPPSPHQIQVRTIEADVVDTNDGATNGSRLAQAASAAIAAALTAAGLNNVTIFRGDDEGAEGEPLANSADEIQGNESIQQQPEPQETPSNNEDQSRRTQQLPRPPQMGELLERLTGTQTRLGPYIDRYRTLMTDDPSLSPGSGPDGVEEHQRIVNGVSESLHYLSHACHALSDIIVDLNQQPPRNLRCRPIIVQHSAILQAGIPIQVEAHISLQGRNTSNNNDENETSNPPTNTTPPSAAAAAAAAPASEENGRRSETSNSSQPQVNLSQSPFGSVFNLPSNVEVLMEMSPENTMESGAGEEQNQNNGGTNNNTGGARMTATGAFPWGGVSPPDFIQNLMQAVAGHVVQGGVATTLPPNINFTTVAGPQLATMGVSVDSNTTNSGQSTQARSNVGTHPTTSTQTRSTSRPHVFHQHSHPLGLGGLGINMGQGLDFDPFLPCNSHHVRRAQSGAQSATTTTASSQTSQPNQPAGAENQTLSQTANPTSTSSESASTANGNQSSSNVGGNPLLNLMQQLSGAVRTQPNASGSNIDQALISLMQMLGGGNVQLGFVQAGGTGVRGVTLANLFERSMGTDALSPQDGPREDSFLQDLLIAFTRNITLEDFLSLRFGRWGVIAGLCQPILDLFRRTFPDTSDNRLPTVVTTHLLDEIRPHLETYLLPECDPDSPIDLIPSLERQLRDSCLRIASLIINHRQGTNQNWLVDEESTLGTSLQQNFVEMVRDLCITLRHSLRGGQRGLETVASRVVNKMVEHIHPSIRQWIVDNFIGHFRTYSMGIAQPPASDIAELLFYKIENAPAVLRTDSENARPVQPEPMETEATNERVSREPLAEDDVEEVPETFSGHEVLPLDWVPVIARDGVRQRRQVQQQDGASAPPFSDAYLGGLPNKRRKLVEQQKPRLLVSPTPNSTAITASMERLVREGINRAGAEEVEGAAVAVAADPGVRSAFGQAIKECLQPKRQQNADFPDPMRFPNATKYFSEQGRPKQ